MAYVAIQYPRVRYGPTGVPVVVPTADVAATLPVAYVDQPPIPDPGAVILAQILAADVVASVVTDSDSGVVMVIPPGATDPANL